MRRTFVLGLVLAMSVVALAADHKDVKLSGYIIDNACSATRATGEGALEKVKAHTTKCAQMPNCAKSGYAIYADGKLYKFDEDGNKKVAELLKNTKTEKGLGVSVEGTADGDIVHVSKIAETTEAMK
jgi:type 1 fimbria pilin